MIACGGTDGCARSSEDNGERRHQHAVRAQKSFSGLLGHWQSTRFGFRFRYYASSLIPNWSPASLQVGNFCQPISESSNKNHINDDTASFHQEKPMFYCIVRTRIKYY
jgi:hypothetical protein